MSSTNRCAKSTFLAFLLAMSSTFAVGHPKLASSTPANASEVTAPQKIELRFSESLVFPYSGANLVMAWEPGKALHGPMRIPVVVSRGDDEKTIVLTPAKPLMPGSYRVDWRAVGSDKHPANGRIGFNVK